MGQIKSVQKNSKENDEGADEPKDPPKVLILGTLDSGKSVLAKRFMFKDEAMSLDQRKSYVDPILSNILVAMKGLMESMKKLEIVFENRERVDDAKLLAVHYCFEPMSNETAEAMKRLCRDAGVQECFAHRDHNRYFESDFYFLNNLDEILSADYVPSYQDVLRTRMVTTGCSTQPLRHQNLEATAQDFGGARSERRKWVHAFTEGNTKVIIFCVALSEYNQVLLEWSDHKSTNRTKESLRLLESICNNTLLSSIPIILLFTKMDVFEEKVKTVGLETFFDDYQGGNTCGDALEFIR